MESIFFFNLFSMKVLSIYILYKNSQNIPHVLIYISKHS